MTDRKQRGEGNPAPLLHLKKIREEKKCTRDHTKVITIGDRKIGGGNPILIQSMTNTKTEDIEATVAQILALEAAGCEIIRCAVPTMEAAKALKEIKKQIHIPLVADISLTTDWQLQLWKTELTKSVSIREILEIQNVSKQWLMWQKKEISLSG